MRWLPIAAASFVLSLAVFGCGGKETAGTPPVVAPELRSVSVTPQTLDFQGGTLTVTATATSTRGIEMVLAEVTRTDDPLILPRLYVLSQVIEGTYRTQIPLAPNFSATGQIASYKLSVYARDLDQNQSGRMEFPIQVTPPEAPPAGTP